jgi:hypothetical protein
MNAMDYRPSRIALAAGLAGVLLWAATLVEVRPAHAAATGKVQGKIVGTDTGEPIGFADVLLIPADTTLRKVGALTNADGTFLLEAAPGRYTIQIRALSYAVKRTEGIVIEAGGLTPFSTGLAPEAILQKEVVVEAKARSNTEASLLSARKRAAAVGDAISAEQVRKSPDKDAAEVLRRVTGLTVSDGKFVYVRGLGERYSSTEVDGVRIASPDQNRRVVPLDLIPAKLLESIVVQKTYTADRPGEFGGGDVQVRTRDFPGKRSFAFSLSQDFVEDLTFGGFQTYESTNADLFGYGAHARRIPDEVFQVAGARKLVLSGNPAMGFTKSTLAALEKSFDNVWTPTTTRALPNGGYAAAYGDELRLLGRPLGLVASANLTRGRDEQQENQKFYEADWTQRYSYDVDRSTETVALGAMGAIAYRFNPRHTVHLRGLYTHNADDEVMTYQGPDHNRTNPYTGADLVHRVTRFTYLERGITSLSLEGSDEFSSLLATHLNWRVDHSEAQRLQPDRRETTFDRLGSYDGYGNYVETWGLGAQGTREYGDLLDRGWGGALSAAVPYRLGGLGNGKAVLGFDLQDKKRRSYYRRFNFLADVNETIYGSPPPAEPLFGQDSVYVDEGTLDQDNYHATSRVTAGYVSLDVPFGRSLRGTFGVRAEHGVQDVVSYDLFDRSRITAQGGFDRVDWLPSGNLTWAMTGAINARFAASRTLSRPDLNELSPTPTLAYVAGYMVGGNPHLDRALIDNYDVRLEAFPGLSEVLAAGFFYKDLHHPIEQTIQEGTPPILTPRNSEAGHNLGVEMEARAAMGRLWQRLNRLALNTNAALISSQVHVRPSEANAAEHPLQGQASYVMNAGLGYSFFGGHGDANLMFSAAGKRLRVLGYKPMPDIYDQPAATIDATIAMALGGASRIKLSARNLLDPRIVSLQGDREITTYRRGRVFAIAYTYGS